MVAVCTTWSQDDMRRRQAMTTSLSSPFAAVKTRYSSARMSGARRTMPEPRSWLATPLRAEAGTVGRAPPVSRATSWRHGSDASACYSLHWAPYRCPTVARRSRRPGAFAADAAWNRNEPQRVFSLSVRSFAPGSPTTHRCRRGQWPYYSQSTAAHAAGVCSTAPPPAPSSLACNWCAPFAAPPERRAEHLAESRPPTSRAAAPAAAPAERRAGHLAERRPPISRAAASAAAPAERRAEHFEGARPPPNSRR